MPDFHRSAGPNLNAIKSDGTVLNADANGDLDIPSTGDWYIGPIDFVEAPNVGVHVEWHGVLAASGLTFEDSNLDDAALNSVVAGEWIKEDSSTAYVPTAGAGGTVTNMTIVITAARGGAMFNLGNLASRKGRFKLAVTTIGKIRFAVHGKS